MVKYKSINKNNVYKKNRRSKKLRKQIQKGASFPQPAAAAGAAPAGAAAAGVKWNVELKYITFIRFLTYLGIRVGYKLDGKNQLNISDFCFDVDTQHDFEKWSTKDVSDEDNSLINMGINEPSFLVNYMHIYENEDSNIWDFDYNASSSNSEYTDYIRDNLQGLGGNKAAATQFDAGLMDPAPPTTHDTATHNVLDTS